MEWFSSIKLTQKHVGLAISPWRTPGVKQNLWLKITTSQSARFNSINIFFWNLLWCYYQLENDMPMTNGRRLMKHPQWSFRTSGREKLMHHAVHVRLIELKLLSIQHRFGFWYFTMRLGTWFSDESLLAKAMTGSGLWWSLAPFVPLAKWLWDSMARRHMLQHSDLDASALLASCKTRHQRGPGLEI